MSLSSSRGVNEGDEKDGDGDHNALLNRRATEMIPRASESGGVSEEAASAAAGEVSGSSLCCILYSNNSSDLKGRGEKGTSELLGMMFLVDVLVPSVSLF